MFPHVHTKVKIQSYDIYGLFFAQVRLHIWIWLWFTIRQEVGTPSSNAVFQLALPYDPA